MSNIDNSYAVKLASYLGHVNGLRVKQAFLEGMDPTAQAALLAGGAGAAVGGIGNALFGKRKKGVGMLGRLGRGALAGGGIGAGLGAGINEGAIRLGMGRTGADRGTYLSNDWGEEGGALPVNYAKSMLSNLLSKKLPPKGDSEADFLNGLQKSYAEGKEEAEAERRYSGQAITPPVPRGFDYGAPQYPKQDNTIEKSPEWESRPYSN